MFATPMRRRAAAFTLIELLVVISIIVLLISILIPALGKARNAAKGAQSLSNLRQIGIATANYNNNNKEYFPAHEAWYNAPGSFSAVASVGPDVFAFDGVPKRRSHWEDHLVEFMPSPPAFLSPLLRYEEIHGTFKVKYAINPYAEMVDGNGDPLYAHGGYGYNMHYLGRAAFFNARDGVQVLAPTRTIVVGDTAGTRAGLITNDPTNSYVVEPPMPSLNYGAKRNRFYPSASPAFESPNPGPYDWIWRAYPAPRNNGSPSFVFADGHAATVGIEIIDDLNGDGVRDNGYWNGLGDPDPNNR